MFRCLLAVSLFVAVLAVACQKESPVVAQEITVAFWNVQNLLDEYDDPLSEYDEKFSESAIRDRLGKDAAVIRSLNADILGLAEVENLPLLKRLVNGYLSKEGYEHLALIEGADPRGIDVALISRYPCLVQSMPIDGLPRDLLAARFLVNGQTFYVVVNHWKSRRDGGGAEVRMNGAKAAAEFVKQQVAEYEGKAVPVILVGDFNDQPEDDSLQYLTDQGLVNTMTSIPEPKRWTHGYYDRDASRMDLLCFDQILVTPDLTGRSGFRWLSTKVHRPPFMINARRSFNGVKIPLPIDDYQERIGYSDHFPVISTFQFK